MAAASKVLTLARTSGPLLVSADLHGNLDDFHRLRQIFLGSVARGEDPTWISLGDWIHGPSEHPEVVLLGEDGVPLYDYPDGSAALLRELFPLMDRHPDRLLSLLGNHEYAHIGGPRTRKFHDDEAAHLEFQLRPDEVVALRQRFASWPLLVRVPFCGLVLCHGAISGEMRGALDLEDIVYGGKNMGPAADLLRAALCHYGYTDGGDLRLLSALRDPSGPPYRLVVHGHDREESGHCPTGERALLLCTSFGAQRARKAYLWLNLATAYDGPDSLREGHEIRFLWSGAAS